MLRTGSPWRDPPSRCKPLTTVYSCFNRCAKAGVWVRVFEALSASSLGLMHLIDRSIIRTHQHAAGGKSGARITPSAVLMGTERQVRRPSQSGRPAAEDRPLGRSGLGQSGYQSPDRRLQSPEALVADQGYDACAVIDMVEARGGRPHIPTQDDRKVQRSINSPIYHQHNVVELYFCKLKHFRRITTRFDKLARTSSPPSRSPQHAFVAGLMSPEPGPLLWRAGEKPANAEPPAPAPDQPTDPPDAPNQRTGAASHQ